MKLTTNIFRLLLIISLFGCGKTNSHKMQRTNSTSPITASSDSQEKKKMEIQMQFSGCKAHQ